MDASEKFKLLEYFKIKTKGEWYTSIAGKLVLKTAFELDSFHLTKMLLGFPHMKGLKLEVME